MNGVCRGHGRSDRGSQELKSFEFDGRVTLRLDRNLGWALSQVLREFNSENTAVDQIGRQLHYSCRPPGDTSNYDDEVIEN